MNILSYDSGEMRKGRIGEKHSRTSNENVVRLNISKDGHSMNLALATKSVQAMLNQAHANHVTAKIKDGRIYIKPCDQDGYAISYNQAKAGGVTKRCSVRIPVTQEEAEALKPYSGIYRMQQATSGTKDLYIDLRERLSQ